MDIGALMRDRGGANAWLFRPALLIFAHVVATSICHVNSADQTQPRPSALELVMRGAIDLEHHPLTGPSFSAASVFDPAALLGGRDPVGSKDTANLFTTELDLFFLELLGQMMIVEVFVLPLR
jgi:hypothetical protein